MKKKRDTICLPSMKLLREVMAIILHSIRQEEERKRKSKIY